MHVTIQKRGDVFGCRRDFVFLQNAGDDAGIGHAGDFDVAEIVLDLEAFFECALERFNAGAAGMNQRAVDVEKKKTFLHSSTDYADFRRWSKSRRAHEEHGDHAREKCECCDRGDTENDESNRIARCRSLPER